MHRPQPPRRPSSSAASSAAASPATSRDLSASCHVLSAQHTAFVVCDRLRARWPQTSFRVQVCDQTVTAGQPGGEQHPLEGLRVEWSDGPTPAEVEDVVDFFRGVEPAESGDDLRRRESLLATPTGHVVLVHYRVGYLTYCRRMSSSYRRHLRALTSMLREHGRQLVLEHEGLEADRGQQAAHGREHLGRDAGAGEHPQLAQRGPQTAQLTVAEAHLLRLPDVIWTPWGIHRGPVGDLLELLARHVSPETAEALVTFPTLVQVSLLLVL